MRLAALYIRRLALFLLAFLAASGVLWLSWGCQPIPQPGEVTWSREHRSPETGKTIYLEKLTVVQNENPETPTIVRVPDTLEVEIGKSYLQKLSSFELPVTLLTGAAILAFIAAALLAAIGKHFRLAGIATGLGLGLIAIAATIDRYSWAYGLGLFGVAIGWGAWLWVRYLRRERARRQAEGLAV